jgi:DNA-binding NarL/FixJ family response regulator
MEPIRTFVIASTLALRAGLRALLQIDSNVEVVGESASLVEMEALSAGIDVLVVAGDLPPSVRVEEALRGLDGQQALVAMADDPALLHVLRRLPLRGWGLLPLDASAEELAAAVRAAHEGLVTCSPALLDAVLSIQAPSGVPAGEGIEGLTEREGEVLSLLSRGLANKQIAGELGITEHTVKFHVSSIYGKLGATNRAEAVRLGARLGLIAL